jgi:deazaflavin-dependent oxidoreductase (nitroreductase family)
VIAVADMDDFNQRIISEFRANGGKVGKPFEGAPMILVTTTGARSGQRRTTPLVYTRDGERYVVSASFAGAPRHPAWYHNLMANPEVTVEVGSETFPARASVVEGEDRQRLYDEQAKLMPAFKEYQEKTARQIPVVALERIG